MRPGRFARAAAGLGLVCLSLAVPGCHPGSARPEAYPSGPLAGRPRHGGSVVMLRESDPDYLDPALSYTTYSSPVIGACNRTLIGYPSDPKDDLLRLVPDMAESMPAVGDGGKLYAFKIRPDERFGKPLHRHVTAADFQYSLERLFRVDSPGQGFFLGIQGAHDFLAHRAAHISGIQARGDSLYIRLDQPNPAFLYAVAMYFASPVPREVAERHPQDYSQHIVSTGPYDMLEFIPRRHEVLVRNPDCRIVPYVDTVEVRSGVTAENAVAQIRKGEADGGFFELPASEYSRLRHDPGTRDQLQVARDLSLYYVSLNTRVRPFDDARVRQAVAWAVDRAPMVKVWCGKGDQACEILPPGMPGFAPGRMFHGPDPARSRELLRQAGYPDGISTTLYCRNEEPDPRTAEVLQAQLAEAGIRARIEVIDGSSYWTEVGRPANRFPMILASWIIDFPEASDYFDVLFNGHRITDMRNNNYAMYDNPRVNSEIEAAMRESDPGARVKRWEELDRKVVLDCPVVPYVHARATRFYSRRLGGYFYHPTRMLYLDRLYIKEPEAAGKGSGS